MSKFLYLLVLCVAVIATCEGRRRPHVRFPSGSPAVQNKYSAEGGTGASTYSYVTSRFTVPLDNFAFASNETFTIRYMYNDTWWTKPNGPIFFYAGNEGFVESFIENSGFMWEIAPEFGALVLFAEHRYYGLSRPYGLASLSDPAKAGYLTSEQALADYANFLLWLKNTQFDGNAVDSDVVVFGGSYGGMLASWFRIKYPHVVVGAIACSAPILLFPGVRPCQYFGEIVTRDFRLSSDACADNIRKSWDLITTKGSTEEGREWLKTTWRMCNSSSLSSVDDVDDLKYTLEDVWTNLAMVDYPYPADFLANLPAYPVDAVCQPISDSSLNGTDLLEAMLGSFQIYYNYTGDVSCLPFNEGSPLISDSGWDFQACTEQIMPICYDGVNDMFEPYAWDLEEYVQECRDEYGVEPRPFMVPVVYGAKNITAASNIVFSNGELDPWASGGVYETLSDTLIAVNISGGAHHLDLRASNPADPQSVIDARNIEKANIRKWLGISSGNRCVVSYDATVYVIVAGLISCLLQRNL